MLVSTVYIGRAGAAGTSLVCMMALCSPLVSSAHTHSTRGGTADEIDGRGPRARDGTTMTNAWRDVRGGTDTRAAHNPSLVGALYHAVLGRHTVTRRLLVGHSSVAHRLLVGYASGLRHVGRSDW